MAPWTVVRWLPLEFQETDLDALSLPSGSRLAYDMGRNPVILFPNEWAAEYFPRTNSGITLSSLPVGKTGVEA
jgi:peptide subunit release factor RF-3